MDLMLELGATIQPGSTGRELKKELSLGPKGDVGRQKGWLQLV